MEKSRFIVRRVEGSGLDIFAQWRVRITAGDVLLMYPGWLPRVTILARLPFLYDCDVFWVKGPDAISQMDVVKHEIRDEIWGRHFEKGGYLHAPDTEAECREHAAILWQRIVQPPSLSVQNI